MLKRQVQLLAESQMVQNKVLYGETPAQAPNSGSWIVKGGGNLGAVGIRTLWKVKEKRKGNGTTPWDDGNQEKTERFFQCYVTLCNLVGKTP